MTVIKQLINYGQSYWMDNLSREMIQSGELASRVKEQGLRGITSNPTIFNKAISSGDFYDEQIHDLAGKGNHKDEIYEKLAIKDIRDACEILRPVFYESEGVDGFVSLEVSPHLAHDTQGTMEEARRLFETVARPNLFIKIPGTKEGEPAIEEMLYEGININITLLFSIEDYEAVAWAYIRGLERRKREELPISNIASVASFFLSRIDTLVDQRLEKIIQAAKSAENVERAERLRGETAVANAKLAYQKFKEIFTSERWQVLAERGARVQRPLWASTSTKNPAYRDVKYIEPLIGRDTVNTMPEETIAAFDDHGVIVDNAVEQNLDHAKQIFAELEELGIDMRKIADQLIKEGVQKFIEPYDKLLATIARTSETTPEHATEAFNMRIPE